jgi:hypothetical protein
MFKGGGGYILISALVGMYFIYYVGYIFIIRSNMGLCVSEKVHSFVIFVFLNYTCEIVQVCVVIGVLFDVSRLL